MGKHVIFLLHGMGTHTEDWSNKAIKEFKANARAIGYPMSLTDDFEFVEISYDHLFLDYINAHNKNAEQITTFMTTAQIGAMKSVFRGLFEYATGSLDNEEFVTSALGDVFLYRLSDYANVVRTYILQVITATLNVRGKPPWSVIAHSMGTRVIHDAMDEFTADVTNRNVFGKPVALAMVANVTHLLAYNPSTLWRKTRVFPAKAPSKGACLRYVNALHPADPFTWIREFDPVPEWGNNAEFSGRYRNTQIGFKELTRGNSHSFTGYLEHPRVAADICWALGTGNTGEPAFDDEKLTNRLKTYSNRTISENAEKTWKMAKKLKQERDLTSFWEFVRALNDFESFIQKFSESLTD
ncbi:hypothetical protein [Pseudohalioglobus lutimaris]|jgi:hypothetical protein|uniref:Alpha/beta hydrolase n=1 Tax=Pseudohalioglobus lutimaris TaxID=1737061 RepID=A0A2N5WZU7_9GAMM|nr:hypothetical protein [Pseudohalioglobus lutimaris]PLW67752.1 hypothetical protein C0039_15135 [Pseudohalioglobus lutimaris]